MKRNLFITLAISLTSIFSLEVVSAQTTILEQDGASNQFVVSDWDFGSSTFSNATSSEIFINSNEAGTLTLNNTVAYNNITVEIIISDNSNRGFQLKLGDNGSGTKTQFGNCLVISDANDPDYQKTRAIVNFNNPTPFALKTLTFLPTTSSMTIVYIKITTSDPAQAATSDLTNSPNFKINLTSDKIHVNALEEGVLNVFNLQGQLLSTHQVMSGDNVFLDEDRGMLLFVFSDKNNRVISKQKMIK